MSERLTLPTSPGVWFQETFPGNWEGRYVFHDGDCWRYLSGGSMNGLACQDGNWSPAMPAARVAGQASIAMLNNNSQKPDHNDNDTKDVCSDFHSTPHVLRPSQLWLGLFFAFAAGLGLGGFAVAIWLAGR